MMLTTILIAFFGSLLAALLLTPFSRWLAKKTDIIDHPGPRKVHAVPTPRLGGLAIYLAFFIATFFLLHWDPQLQAIFISSSMLLLISIADDKWRVSALLRFIVHILAVVVLINYGITIELIKIPYISFPIAVLWIVGVCNAFNAMDSVDGLLGGLTVIYCIILGGISFWYQEHFVTICCAALAGASLGFLRFNFNKASIFLGDSGSTFLGFITAVLILRGIGPSNIVVPVMVIGLPIYDIILVHMRRYRAGTNNLIELLASTGKDHLAHRLMDSGLSKNKAVFVIFFYTLVTAAVAFLFIKPNVAQQVVILVIIGIMTFFAESLTVVPKEKLSIIHHSKPDIWEDEVENVAKTVRSGFISQGEKVLDFEDKMLHFIGRRYAVAVNSGSSALHLVLLALGIGEGDEVILSTYSSPAALNPIHYVGAKPVLTDVAPAGFSPSAAEYRRVLSKKTKALLVPHLFGCPARLDDIVALGIPVIEDCTHAIGGAYNGKEIGSYGLMSFSSFYSTRMLTTGEGGVVMTDDEQLHQRVLDLREYDMKEDYRIRYNYKLTDIQAALGLVQLERLPEFIRSRRVIARKYTNSFSELAFTLPVANRNRSNVFFRYVACTDQDLDEVIGNYHHLGIEVKKPIYSPLHRYIELDPGQFPRAEELTRTAFSLPVYPSLSGKEIERIIEVTYELFS